MVNTITALEAALVSRITSQVTQLADCSSYAGQIEDANNGLPVEAPAAFVMFDGLDVISGDSDRVQLVSTVRFSVVVFGDSYVGGTNNRTLASKGAYALLDAVILAVNSHNLGITGFYGFNLDRVEPVKTDKLRAIYVARFSTQVEVNR